MNEEDTRHSYQFQETQSNCETQRDGALQAADCMGGPEEWPQPSGLTPTGVSSFAGLYSSASSVDKERWDIAELRIAELITCIQPTKSSEDRRKAVADYVQSLIRRCFDCQVFTFGSVPLKTYLPDGDIDLTAFSHEHHLKDSWATDVRSILERAEHDEDAEFRVQNVQYIHAEVKLIKCVVENIVVDISFNQLGGLCTLCFLEEVDRVIGRNHLFKRSIILVKAWCYYESHILGAHHGLISTYALETLVLYIFHVFHASLRGPLEVLFRFLEFFSKFDWDRYCVSLWGPVPLSLLPEITAENPRRDGGELLLSKAFLDACGEEYAVFPTGQDSNGRVFISKFLNVIDPLRPGNNLGRSVSKANFYRIRGVFEYGAERLAKVLQKPQDKLIAKLDMFFDKTWKRNVKGQRPDASEPNSFTSSSVGISSVPSTPSSQSFKHGALGRKKHDDVDVSVAFKGDNYGVTSVPAGNEPEERAGVESRKPSLDSLSGLMADNFVNGSRRSGDARDFVAIEQNNTLVTNEPAEVIPMTDNSKNGSRENNKGGKMAGSTFSITQPVMLGTSDLAEVFQGNPLQGGRQYFEGHGAESGLDLSGHATRGQDTSSRAHIPLSVSLLPSYVQIPMSLTHPGQMPMHMATSLAVSSMGPPSLTFTGPPPPHLGLHATSAQSESSLGLAPRASPYLTMQLPRGPVPPPLPPYFHGPPIGQYLPALADNSSVTSNRLSATYPLQQGDDKTYEQHQRDIWQQMEQMQLQDHQQQYGVMRAVPSTSSAGTLHPHLTAEAQYLLSASPTVVTSGSLHIPVSTLMLRPPSAPVSLGNGRLSRNGSTASLDTSTDVGSGSELPEDGQMDDSGKMWQEGVDVEVISSLKSKAGPQQMVEPVSKGSKSSKPGKERRVFSKGKFANSEESVDLNRVVDGTPALNGEGTIRWPHQGTVDEGFFGIQGYSQMVPNAGTVSGSVVYPNLLPLSNGNSSSLASVVSDATGMSLYPPPIQPQHRSTTSHGVTHNPVASMSGSISTGSSSSFRPPGSELGSVGIGAGQRQRPMENSIIPQNVYYPAGTPYPFLSMYSTYPMYMIPHNLETGYMGIEMFNGHLFGSNDSLNDSSAVQSTADELRLKTHKARSGVGERLRASGIPVHAGPAMDVAQIDSRGSEGIEDSRVDLLSSEFSNHLRNLEYGRWCQNPRLPSPVGVQAPSIPPTKFLQGYRPWEGPGRPVHPNMNMVAANVASHGPGLVPAPLSMNGSMNGPRMGGNFPRYAGPVSFGGDEQPKPRGGTGTYLPTPRPNYYRDRQSSGGSRNQHGGYSQDRTDRADRDGSQLHAPRFRGAGRGQNKYEPRSQNTNVGVERNGLDGKSGERGHDAHRQQEGLRRNPIQSPAATVATPSPTVSSVTLMSHTSVGVPVGTLYSVPMISSNGKSAAPGAGPPAIVTYGNPYDSRVNFVPEPLEFGSFGPVQVAATQGGSELDHGAGHVPIGQFHEQVYAPPPLASIGCVLASGDRSPQVPSSPKQRAIQRTYQLTEEDFPPLSFCGQHGRTSAGMSSSSSAGSRGSPYQSFVASLSS